MERIPRIAQHPLRMRALVARQPSTVVPSAAMVHQDAGRPVHQMAPGRSSDPTAISSSARAHAAAVAPQAAPAASDSGAVTAAQTPAIVVNAASGMVSTLSGAAHPLAVPACARAIGVLTVQATTEESTAAAAASATCCASSRLGCDAGIHPMHRSDHRAHAGDASTKSATTTP